MVNEYKKIVLLKGLEVINEYQFNMIKSLLAHDLQLNKKAQHEYNRIQIADLMEDKFQGAACLDTLIELFQDIEDLKDLAKTLKREKIKVEKKIKLKRTPVKNRKQETTSSATPAPTTSKAPTSERAEDTPAGQKRKSTTKEKPGTKRNKASQEQNQTPCPSAASTSVTTGHPPPPQISSSTPSSTSLPEEEGERGVASTSVQNQRSKAAARKGVLQKNPMTVMVLSATKPFEYESPEKGKNTMFHATVITESKYFQVKVFNTKLKQKFTRKKVITISNYFQYKGILEVNEASFVSEAGPDQKIDVSKNSIRKAKKTPNINTLHKEASGNVYGLFTLHKKTVNKKNTIYEIQDRTGKMIVVGKGKCHDIKCEEGDKLQLFCFRLRKTDQGRKLTSENHSYIERKRKPNRNTDNSKGIKPGQKQIQLPKTSAASTPPTDSDPQTTQEPLPTPSSSSLNKEMKYAIPETYDTERIKLPQEQYQLPQTLVTIPPPPHSLHQTPQMLLLTPSSSFFTQTITSDNKYPDPWKQKTKDEKNMKTTSTQASDSKGMNLPQKQHQLPQTVVYIPPPSMSLPQPPQMLLLTPPNSSLNQKMKDTVAQTDVKRMKLPQEQYQLPQTLMTITPPPKNSLQPPQMFLLTPSKSSLTEKKQYKTTTTDGSKRLKLTPEQSQLQQTSVANTPPTESCPRIHQMPLLSPSSSFLTKKPILKTEPKEASREEGVQRGPKKVMVLKATEPFVYDYGKEERKMFHATVATESEFFRVKVFDISLKEKFIPNRVIAISNYVGRNGFLEVYRVSSVSNLNADQKMDISSTLIANANATPKISHLCLQVQGTFVNGVFKVHKKRVVEKHIFYEIQDDTGKMEVSVFGQLTRIKCEEGDECQFICFELESNEERRQLKSVLHSFIKVETPGSCSA
ncbi:gamma-interferon-inducible protein 16 isoform X2 [Trichechus manatus latirostris]|uniref:Gamma-interferon-inducible protein 16 isoform X2 n=1 Tax=Trichechus manatus latirostris TaxID=127582 RepID=A0A2Y9QI29_TRIMA|nr:gamma-interferon-inducible protein 16 isoform X2 [Trichechus manatus latirostris]